MKIIWTIKRTENHYWEIGGEKEGNDSGSRVGSFESDMCTGTTKQEKKVGSMGYLIGL